ncbi:MAG: DUF4382 domain-containing protein, partial [Steroidobacteraceae bacterium]
MMNTQVAAVRRIWSLGWVHASRATAAALLLFAVGCAGGSGSVPGLTAGTGSPTTQSCDAASCGTALVTVTDADGDFTSYTLDVTSVILKRADGTVVETLPARQRIDFAQLVNVSELVTAMAVPQGEYVSGAISVDYTQADVEVEVGGESQKANVVDANGKALGPVQLDLQLDPKHRLMVTAGRVSRLALDFNLSASNTVDLTSSPVKVTARPVVVASIVPAETKEVRVRGALVSVDTTAGSYIVAVKPFREQAMKLGQVTVLTGAQTTFEINGRPLSGADGLKALAALPPGTMTAAFGSLQTSDQTFTAARVLAGSSIESRDADALVGSVIARSGRELTVRGATLERREGDDRFLPRDVKLLVGDATVVTRAGDPSSALTQSAISVGQRVVAFGTASQAADGTTTVDANQGRVRLEYTRITGPFVSGGAGIATITLQSIDGRAASAFNFAGTGATATQDATPSAYEVNTSTLPIGNIAAGAPTRFIGFVTPFGAAPPDFQARTLVDYSNTASLLQISWRDGGTATPFASSSATAVVVDLGNAQLGERHTVRTGPQLLDLKSLAGNPAIVPDGSATAMYAIRSEERQVKVFASFADFVTELTARLTSSAKIESLWALGKFNATTNTFT